jgi:hypothetical protein
MRFCSFLLLFLIRFTRNRAARLIKPSGGRKDSDYVHTTLYSKLFRLSWFQLWGTCGLSGEPSLLTASDEIPDLGEKINVSSGFCWHHVPSSPRDPATEIVSLAHCFWTTLNRLLWSSQTCVRVQHGHDCNGCSAAPSTSTCSAFRVCLWFGRWEGATAFFPGEPSMPAFCHRGVASGYVNCEVPTRRGERHMFILCHRAYLLVNQNSLDTHMTALPVRLLDISGSSCMHTHSWLSGVGQTTFALVPPCFAVLRSTMLMWVRCGSSGLPRKLIIS